MLGFFYSRSRGQTAAALHANLLDSTNDMWKQADAPTHPPYFAKHVFGAGRLKAPMPLPDTKPTRHFADVTFVAPNAFVKPQPRPSLSRILNWQDQTERCSPQSNTNAARKSIIEKILLVAGRRRAENEGSNAAPAWPPAPELIANPPNWGPKATGRPSSNLVLNIALPVASTVSAGHFVGRDGTEWPLPPTECMPKSSPSPIAPPQARPTLALGSSKWTAPNAVLDTVEGADAWFLAELHAKHGTLSCSTAATSLPHTPADEVVLLPVRKAKVVCAPRWGVIGDGRPNSRPEPACPPTPFLGPSLCLPSPPFVESEAAYDDETESVIGYWSESESGSEYSESEYDDDEWSVRSVYDSDSDDEGESEPDFFLASDGAAWPLPPVDLSTAAGAIHRGRNPVPKW
ncbi:hypothetical protein V8D89_010371 [Ganoderma adspersum]